MFERVSVGRKCPCRSDDIPGHNDRLSYMVAPEKDHVPVRRHLVHISRKRPLELRDKNCVVLKNQDGGCPDPAGPPDHAQMAQEATYAPADPAKLAGVVRRLPSTAGNRSTAWIRCRKNLPCILTHRSG